MRSNHIPTQALCFSLEQLNTQEFVNILFCSQRFLLALWVKHKQLVCRDKHGTLSDVINRIETQTEAPCLRWVALLRSNSETEKAFEVFFFENLYHHEEIHTSDHLNLRIIILD